MRISLFWIALKKKKRANKVKGLISTAYMMRWESGPCFNDIMKDAKGLIAFEYRMGGQIRCMMCANGVMCLS